MWRCLAAARTDLLVEPRLDSIASVRSLLESYLALLGADRTVVEKPAQAPSLDQLSQVEISSLLKDMLRFMGMDVDTP